MSCIKALGAAYVSLVIVVSSSGRQAVSSAPRGSQLLQQSLGALNRGQTFSDVTLSGTARRIAGSDDETGFAVFKALAIGAGRIDLTLPSGQRRELANFAATPPTGSWSATDGVSHATPYHNLLTEPSWFFPAFAISRRLSDSSFVFSYVGHETRNGESVEHISACQPTLLADASGSVSSAHLTKVDFFLDSATLLPATITLNVHPDNNALFDIPVEIRFSDYRQAGGSQVPFHIQRFLNNSLALDFQVQTVVPNSGLSAATFGAE